MKVRDISNQSSRHNNYYVVLGIRTKSPSTNYLELGQSENKVRLRRYVLRNVEQGVVITDMRLCELYMLKHIHTYTHTFTYT